MINNYEQLDNRVTYWKNKIRNKQLKKMTLKTAKSLLEEKIKTLFTFFQKYIKQTIQEDLLLVLLTATLVQFQNLLIITYNLR